MLDFDQSFEKFVKDQWPGFNASGFYNDFENACFYTNIKQAFKAGWDANVKEEINV